MNAYCVTERGIKYVKMYASASNGINAYVAMDYEELRILFRVQIKFEVIPRREI